MKLIREVLDHAPADLSPAEMVVLLVLAESANDKTRQAWPGMESLATRTRLSPTGVRSAFQRLAERGIEVRMAISKDKQGRPVYACKGRQTTYQVPPLTVQSRPDGVAFVDSKPGPAGRLSGAKGDTKRGQRRHGTGSKATPARRPSPQNRQEPSASTSAMTVEERTAVMAEIRRRRPDIGESLRRHIFREDGPTILAELRDEQERTRIAAAIAEARKGPMCDHGQRGGEALHPTSGEPLCAQCRFRFRAARVSASARPA